MIMKKYTDSKQAYWKGADNRFEMNGEPTYRTGYYFSNRGAVFISDFEDGRYGAATTLRGYKGNKIHERRYERVFTDHGLQMVCAKFLKDLNGK